MPSTLTHYIFNSNLSNKVEHKDIFLLGGQGADVFFFYGYNLAKRENPREIQNIGAQIHQINPDELYMKMLAYVFSKTGEEKSVLLEYTRGFMYHYALDRNIHPYVFYNTGFPYTNKIYNTNHGKFESILDTLLAKEYNCTKTTRATLKTSKKDLLICSKMLSYVLNDYFQTDVVKENSFYQAYKDFRFVRLIADSKYGVKKFLFHSLMKDSQIDVISQPRKVEDDIKYDYLNKKHGKWVNPSTGIVETMDINELFEKAKEDCRIIDTIIYNYKNNIVTQRKITKFTNNINHDGRCLDKYMTYFKIIWKVVS